MNIYTIVFIITFMLSLWCIDVSVTTLNLGIMTNGFINLNPIQSYHLGLYGAILSFFFMIISLDIRARK
jgi:hypothetical protein